MSDPTKPTPGEPHAARRDDPESEAERLDREHLAKIRRTRQARAAKAIFALAVVVILVIFVLQNSHPVRVDFVFFERTPQLIWVLIVTAVLGGVLGFLLGRPSKATRFHRKDERRRR